MITLTPCPAGATPLRPGTAHIAFVEITSVTAEVAEAASGWHHPATAAVLGMLGLALIADPGG
jgi:hypothetical protein